MCDYSIKYAKTRDAEVGDKLVTYDFGSGTKGFAPVGSFKPVAVCVKPGTEIAFDQPIEFTVLGMQGPDNYRTAIFRQRNKNVALTHHDYLEFPDGEYVALTALAVGQHATVLQLPAAPRNEIEAEEQRRVEFVE